MKSTISLSCALLGAMLISGPSFIQAQTKHLLTQSLKETGMETEKNKATISKLYQDTLNTGKFELLAHIVSENYEGIGGEKGPAGFAKGIIPVRAAFPDIKWSIEDLIAEGDKVVVKWSWTGTNTSSFTGFPITNKTVTHHAINIFRFDKGKIIKGWMQSDRLGFFQQIGVIAQDAITPPDAVK